MAKTLDDHLLGNFSEKDFAYYKSFFQKEDALPYAELLKEKDVPFRLEGTDVLITEAIVGTPSFPRIILRILPEDFKKVNRIIELEIKKNVKNFDDHYLNDYTDRELLNILKEPDKSSIEDFIITQILLKSRGIPIDASALEGMKQERLEILKQGKDENSFSLATYFVLLILGAVFFSPLAMIAAIGMGWYYWKDKSVDLDGNSYFTFNSKTRNFGAFILFFGAFIVVTSIFFALFLGVQIIQPSYEFFGDSIFE